MLDAHWVLLFTDICMWAGINKLWEIYSSFQHVVTPGTLLISFKFWPAPSPKISPHAHCLLSDGVIVFRVIASDRIGEL